MNQSLVDPVAVCLKSNKKMCFTCHGEGYNGDAVCGVCKGEGCV